MKQLVLVISLLIASLSSVAQTDTWFVYPTAPENLPHGRQRANYIVEHFWDRCPWKQAYSSEASMTHAIEDFASFLPHASADTVHQSIQKLIDNSSKRPEDLAALLRIAEATFHSDTATLYSDEVYTPFARAGAKAKKFKPELKKKYAAQLQILESSSEGSAIPPLMAFRRDGSPFAINDSTAKAQTYVYIFEEPGSVLNRLDRIRFASNVSAEKLINSGILKPFLLCIEQPDDDWWDSTSGLSEAWSVGYLPKANEYFDLRQLPTSYIVDPELIINSKLLPINILTANCEQLISTLR